MSNLRRWNRGLPRKEFLMVVNLDRQWWALEPAPVCGEPGGVTPTATTAKPTILYACYRSRRASQCNSEANARENSATGYWTHLSSTELFLLCCLLYRQITLSTNYELRIKRGVANFKKQTRTILCTVQSLVYLKLFIFNIKSLCHSNKMSVSDDFHHLLVINNLNINTL